MTFSRFSSESDPDSNKADPSGPSRPPTRPIFSNPLLPQPLTDSDFKPFKTCNPPPTTQHNWDIPLTPNEDKNNNYDKPILITEADFRLMNPADLFMIVRKLSTKEYQVAREAYVTTRRFLHHLLEEFCVADAELFILVNLTYPIPEKVDLSMPENRDNWKKGATFDPVLGLVYKNPKQKGSLFFLRADQI
ncbi:hypothetical protein L2E82_44864 [Cichorium intybus]|uniref:Uncharacterized protein n=1 Tax=Cichorium intybus TaxID=13427 RepID=A0ACB8ZRH7_CICIN|nr:hypothetical protein L2E82_44864 [Cichorium intybus]